LAVGAEEEIIRFAGVVFPQNIQGSTVLSSQVADARIEYRGAGVTDEVQRPGWLTRLFMRHAPN
jgi:flagellar L-ring protein FlgH